jgi:hypothetical protein
MKPLHIGLLVVGAALAGGLALKMTELPPIPVTPSEAIHPNVGFSGVVQTAPALQPAPPAQVELLAPGPAKTKPLPIKPSPIPRRSAPAPAPIFATPWKTAVPRNKPLAIAKAIRPVYPPPPYETPRSQPQAPAPAVESSPAPVPAPQVQRPPQPPPPPQRQVTLPAGMTVPVRLNGSLSTDHSMAGDPFHASLAEPLIVDGLVIAERGARVEGRVIGTQRVARASGTSSLDLELTSIETSDGQNVEIPTDHWTRNGDSMLGKRASVTPDMVIRFRLTSPVTVKERQL